MTAIPTTIHRRLTAPERIRATVSALARGDHKEAEALSETCPKQSRAVMEPAYAHVMHRLFSIQQIIEAELSGQALDFLLASRLQDREATQHAIREARTLEAAWRALLAELGIQPAEMSLASSRRHEAVSVILTLSNEELEAETIQAHIDVLKSYLSA